MGSGRDPSVASLEALVAELPEDLRTQALTHSSWTPERSASYERLAFIGDSVLGLAVAAEVFARFPEDGVGALTKIRNQAVSGISCATVGRSLGVAEMLSATEASSANAIPAALLLEGERPLPEVTEALIGACFLAFGFERTAAAVAEAFQPRISLAAEKRIDFKSALQEALARQGDRVTYEVLSEQGPPHERFEVSAMVGENEMGRGSGRSKKAAEQVAAEQALEALGG